MVSNALGAISAGVEMSCVTAVDADRRICCGSELQTYEEIEDRRHGGGVLTAGVERVRASQTCLERVAGRHGVRVQLVPVVEQVRVLHSHYVGHFLEAVELVLGDRPHRRRVAVPVSEQRLPPANPSTADP